MKKPAKKTPTLAQWRKLHPRAGVIGYSVRGNPWGGMSYNIGKLLLEEAGIPHQKVYTPFVGHWAVEVPKMFRHKADKILL